MVNKTKRLDTANGLVDQLALLPFLPITPRQGLTKLVNTKQVDNFRLTKKNSYLFLHARHVPLSPNRPRPRPRPQRQRSSYLLLHASPVPLSPNRPRPRPRPRPKPWPRPRPPRPRSSYLFLHAGPVPLLALSLQHSLKLAHLGKTNKQQIKCTNIGNNRDEEYKTTKK